MESCEEFFKSTSSPEDLSAVAETCDQFIAKHKARRPVVLITSGGTTVPLEKNTVRYLDNFSTGRRGATSAEHFISGGYAVIFLHRNSSLKPFQTTFTCESFLEWLTLDEKGEPKISVPESYRASVASITEKYQQVKRDDSLLMMAYTTVSQYLFYLREIATLLRPLESRAMIYLAAAVSDFYVKEAHLAEHKIQSSGRLEINFSHTPKMLLLLTSKWAPKAYVVTFKLETDASLLLPHAKAALQKYRHQIVVANLLGKHRSEVTMVPGEDIPSSQDNDDCTSFTMELKISQDELLNGKNIEELIVKNLIDRHSKFSV